MPNTVQIVITVDNTGAPQKIGQVSTSLQSLLAPVEANTAALQALTAQLTATGASAVSAGNGLRTLNGHVSSSLDGVRLLSQEFGLRLPRALESMIARIPGAAAALQSIIGGAAFIAVAEVAYRAGEAVYNLYEKYISLGAAASAYYKTVEEHRDEAFINPQSIEDASARFADATENAKNFLAASKRASDQAGNSFKGNAAFEGLGAVGYGAAYIADKLNARKLADEGYKFQEQADALATKQLATEHQIALQKIEAAHATDAALQGESKINADRQKHIQIDAEIQRHTAALASQGQQIGNRNSGKTEQALADQIANGQAAAQSIELQRQVTARTIALRNEATNAGLQGTALLEAQEQQAIYAVTHSATKGAGQVEAVQLRFHNEQMKRLQTEQDAVQKRTDDEHIAGLTGLAQIQARGDQRIGDIDTNQARGLYSSSADAEQDRATARAATLRELNDAEKKFREQAQAADERADDAQIGGFGRVDAALQRSLDERADAFTKLYGDLDHQDKRYIAGQQQLAADAANITAQSARERAQLESQIADQTLEADKRASAAEAKNRNDDLGGWLDRYHQTTQEIVAEHAAMIAKINEQERKPGVTDAANASFERQKVDADRTANAQIADANEELKNKISSQLEDAFSNPMKFIQDRFKKLAFDMFADFLTQSTTFKGIFNQQMGGLQIGAQGTGAGAAGSRGGGGNPLSNFLGAAASPLGFAPAGSGSGSGSGSASAQATPAGLPASLPLGLGDKMAGLSIPTSLLFGGSSGSSTSALLGGGAQLSGLNGIGASASAVGDGISLPGLGPAGSDGSWDGLGLPGLSNPTPATSQVPTGTGGLSSLGQLAGAGVGAYTGAMSIYQGFLSGKPSGILGAAGGGAELGGSIGMLAGPEGALIGAGVGAAGGLAAGLTGWATGEGNNEQGKNYYKTTILPAMEAALTSYGSGGGSVTSALSSLNQAARTGYESIAHQFGASAANWTRASYISKEQATLTAQISQMAAGGHDYTQATAAQFHSGGTISGFGDLATSGNEGFIHAMLNETVMTPGASSAHGAYLGAMNAGASPADVAAMYLRSAGTGVGSAGGSNHYGDVHKWDVDAIDASSFEDMLKNRGGFSAIRSASNAYMTSYAGDDGGAI